MDQNMGSENPNHILHSDSYSVSRSGDVAFKNNKKLYLLSQENNLSVANRYCPGMMKRIQQLKNYQIPNRELQQFEENRKRLEIQQIPNSGGFI